MGIERVAASDLIRRGTLICDGHCRRSLYVDGTRRGLTGGDRRIAEQHCGPETDQGDEPSRTRHRESLLASRTVCDMTGKVNAKP